MKKSLFFFLVISLILSCGGSDDGPTPEPPVNPSGLDNDDVQEDNSFDISVESTSVTSFQIIEFGVPNDVQLTQNTYQALFGSEEITITTNENNLLSFITPDVQSGDYNFSIQIGDKKGELAFELSQIQDVENVDEFLNQELFYPLNQSREEANVALANEDITNEERIAIEQGNQLYEAGIQTFDGFSNEEKQQFSKFLIANEISFVIDEATDKTFSKSIFDWGALDADARKLVVAKIKLVAIIGTVTAVLLAPEPVITKVIAVLAGAYGVYKLWDVLTIRERIINRIFIPVENLLESISGKSSSIGSKTQDLILTNDTPSSFRVTSTGRKIVKNDENHPDNRIANAVREINETDNRRNELKLKIDELLNVVGSFFGLGDNQIQETDGLPESVAEEIITVALENFFIDNHPEDIEVSIVAIDANTLQLKFTSQTNEPTQFTANFIYDDGDFRTETALNVNLEKKEENEIDMEGTWILQILGGGSCSIGSEGTGNARSFTVNSDGSVVGDGTVTSNNGSVNYSLTGNDISVVIDFTIENNFGICPDGSQVRSDILFAYSFNGEFDGDSFVGTYNYNLTWQDSCMQDENNECIGEARLFRN